MFGFRQRPIRQKLILMSVAGSGLALLMTITCLAALEVIAARGELVNRITMLAAVVAGNSTAALSFGNAEDAATNLSVLKAEPQVRTACFYDAQNRLFATYTKTPHAAGCPKQYSPGTAPVFAGQLIRYSHRVVVSGNAVGSLLIVAEATELNLRLRRYGVIAMLVLAVSVGGAIVIAARLQRVISQPIHQLLAVARRVSAERDYSVRAEQTTEDELGLLVATFNDMLTQIQRRDASLEQHRDRLDHEVKLRTGELEAAVKDLRVEVEQRHKAEQHVRLLADYDVLTGLPNRRLLRQRLQRAITGAEGKPRKIMALLFLDLNRFKQVNDQYGHATGDELLEQVAERLRRSLRPKDALTHRSAGSAEPTVSRQGGDEFTVFLEDIKASSDAGIVATRINRSLRKPFVLAKATVHIGASIGIAVYPQDGQDADTLLQHADTAMYHAKRDSKGDFEYFSSAMKAQALQRLAMEAELRTAIKEQQFFLNFQPIVDLRSGEIVQFEALIRWQHPERGLIGPDAFIPVAENCGLINRIGDWVLQQACREARGWVRPGRNTPRLAVNASSRQFNKGQIRTSVLAALKTSGLAPALLELEATETSVLENEIEAVQILADLQRHGVSIALDDFGTGYSSLRHLQNVPLNTLKIDRSFISEIEIASDARSIVMALITMAHQLSLKVIAEGVETAVQRDLLRQWNCDLGQGYLFSKPVSAGSVAALLDGERRSSTA